MNIVSSRASKSKGKATIWKFCDMLFQVFKSAYNIGERSSGPKILLLQAKFLAIYMG
jgi:hypothetical protein